MSIITRLYSDVDSLLLCIYLWCPIVSAVVMSCSEGKRSRSGFMLENVW